MTARTGYWDRKRISRRTALRTGGTFATGVAGAALVGCGGDDDDEGGDNGGEQPGAEPTATLVPKSGGKLRWGSTGDINPATMPTYQSVTSSFPLQHAVTDYLTKYEGVSLENVKGHVATRWEQTSPLDMTLHLRPGVKWHDGDTVTANDIVFNFQKIIGSRSAVESLSKRVTPTAVNETTVNLKFAKPLPSVFDLLNYMYLNQPKNYDKLAKGEAIIGSGPFMFKDWTPGSKATIVKNPNYWQQGKPYLDEIEYHILPAANLATTMEAGGIDYSLSLNVSEAQRLGKQSQFRLTPGSPGFAFQFVNTNTTHPALVDKRVRQAINYAMDRTRIKDEVFGGLPPTKSIVFPEYSPGYDKGLDTRVTKDLTKAKSLLSAAGYNSSSATELPLSYSAGAIAEGIMTILQNDLKEIGMKTKLDPVDAATATKHGTPPFSWPGLFTGLLGYAGMYPTTFLLATGRIQPPNYLQYNPAGYQAFLDKTFDEGNVEATRPAAMKAFNEFMLDESMMMPMCSYLFLHLMRSNLQGFNYNVVDDIRWEEIWLS